jgi:glycosyltransferase involved in cell wall biosynthesis
MTIWIINHNAAVPSQAWSTRHVSLGAELVRRGHSINLFASNFSRGMKSHLGAAHGGHIQWEQALGVEMGWLPTPGYSRNSWGRGWNMLVFAFRVLDLPRNCSAKPDIIYGSTPDPLAALAGWCVARRLGVTFVLEIRDIWPQSLIDLGMSRFHPFVVVCAAIERHLYSHSDAIVTLMPDAEPHLVARGATRERIHWIPNGVNFDLVPPVVPPKPKEALEIMYAGAYGGGNNPELILDAAAKLRERGGPPLRFRFLGSGAREHALLAKRAALKLENVSFEPPVPKIQVYSLLGEADILLAPYAKLGVHRFGVSLNKLFDYMAVARPIVFSTSSSNHPVTDAHCGFEISADDPDALADSISALAGMSPEERWQLGLNGRHYVEQNHDFARLAVKLETILAGASREALAPVTAPQQLNS